MSPTSRRTVLYWLLLLVPALVVGAGAIFLLQREQNRLAERSAETEAARQATAAARARLIVENVELLVGDVQTGLLDALAAEPAEGLDGFLEQWERNNPLVRIGFRATPDGRIVRPAARSGNEEAQGFLRRFSAKFGGQPPWVVTVKTEVGSKVVAAENRKLAEPEARQEVAGNVAQVRSARRDVQDLLKTRDYSAGASSTQPLADSVAPAAAAPAVTLAESDAFSRDQRAKSERVASSAAEPVAQSRAATPRAKDSIVERRDWLAWLIDDRLHMLGWLQTDTNGAVRGLELETTALISRLGGALPAEVIAGEGFALRDGQGRIIHQIGSISTGAPATRVPLSVATLPGWDVVGFIAPLTMGSGGGAGVLWGSVLLVTLFVGAIVVGGSLLMRQARRSEEEAAQKTSFVANVSHEFKTPLTTIRLYAELLEQGRVRDANQGRDYLQTIGRETQRLARLVNNALDFSRLEQGRKKFNRERIDLTAELSRLLDVHAPRLAETQLTLRRDFPSAPVTVVADRDALEQIVLNLIDNATKYAAEGGEVEVAIRSRDPEGADVVVRDRGPGVPIEHQAAIFEKFHRVDNTLTAEKSGAGLGLSIARQLARGMGGDLRYTARDGGGAEFVLQLR